MNKVWSDDAACDRTEGHKGVAEVFRERYGVELDQWRKTACCYDGGDASFYLGYVERKGMLLRVEVTNACDGDYIKECK